MRRKKLFDKKDFLLKEIYNTSLNISKIIIPRIVCVKHLDGTITEHGPITNPWKYIAKVKRAPDVIDSWIKRD